MKQITRLAVFAGVLCGIASPAAAQDPQWVRDLQAQVEAGAASAAQSIAAQFGQADRARARAERDRERAQRARESSRGPEYTEPFTRTVKLGPKGTIDLSTIAGDIRVTAGGGDDVKIEAVKHVRGASPEQGRAMLQDLQIQVDQRQGLLEIRTEFPRRTSSATVDYTLTVPAGTSVTLKTISGNLTIAGLKGDVSASSVSGDVTLRGSRSHAVDLQTVSGNVHVEAPETDRMRLQSVSGDIEYAGRLARNGRYDFQSHSGDIRIVAPESSGFDLEATTFSGDVTSDYPVTLRGGGVPPPPGRRLQGGPPSPPAPPVGLVSGGPGRSVRGSFGDASALLTLRTFSGSIAIVKK